MSTAASLCFICDLGSQHALLRIKSTCTRASNVGTEFDFNTYRSRWHDHYINLRVTSYLSDHKQGLCYVRRIDGNWLAAHGSPLTAGISAGEHDGWTNRAAAVAVTSRTLQTATPNVQWARFGLRHDEKEEASQAWASKERKCDSILSGLGDRPSRSRAAATQLAAVGGSHVHVTVSCVGHDVTRAAKIKGCLVELRLQPKQLQMLLHLWSSFTRGAETIFFYLVTKQLLFIVGVDT